MESSRTSPSFLMGFRADQAEIARFLPYSLILQLHANTTIILRMNILEHRISEKHDRRSCFNLVNKFMALFIGIIPQTNGISVALHILTETIVFRGKILFL